MITLSKSILASLNLFSLMLASAWLSVACIASSFRPSSSKIAFDDLK